MLNSTQYKICPINLAYCGEEQCAWWDKKNKCCMVYALCHFMR